MGEHFEPVRLGFDGDRVGEFGVAGIVIGHVLDHVRRFMAGVDAAMARIGVHVTAEVGNPMRVEDQERIGAAFARAPADFAQCANRCVALAVQRSGPLGNQNGRDMRDLCGEYDFTHRTFSSKLAVDAKTFQANAIDTDP